MGKFKVLITGLLILFFTFFAAYNSFKSDNSNENGETRWKTYNGKVSNVRFKIKYPPKLRAQNLTIASTDYFLLSNFDISKSALVKSFKDGDILLIITIDNLTESHKQLKSQDSTFSDFKAKKIVGENDNASTLVYTLSDAEIAGNGKVFIFDCHISPPNEVKLDQICGEIARSFKFLD